MTDEVKPGILSSTFHFPEIMLNVITGSSKLRFAAQWIRCSVSDSLVRRTADVPEYKVVTCRIRKTKKAHLRKAGEVTVKA